jgi:hypothetical protein
VCWLMVIGVAMSFSDEKRETGQEGQGPAWKFEEGGPAAGPPTPKRPQ